VSPLAAPASTASGLEDAPTTLFDEEVPDGTDVGNMTVEERRDPWAAAGLKFGPGLTQQYRLVQCVAQGGPMEAFIAEHGILGRRVLIKALAASAAGSEGARAFLAEATALWQLSHPSFPAVLEYGTDLGGRPFVIMEYAAGVSLRERLEGSPLTAELALDLAEQISSALAAAHARGVAHGALSTGAIHLCEDSALRAGLRVKIADFAAGVPGPAGEETGLVVARAVGAARPEDDVAATGELIARLGAAAGLSLSAGVARSLEGLIERMRAAPVAGQPTMTDVARELRRLQLETELEARASRTGLMPSRLERFATVWHGAAVFAGGIVLSALLGAIL
jgi:serine/threonine protein kinase